MASDIAHRYGGPCKHCGQPAYDYNVPVCLNCRRTAERNGTDALSRLYTPGKAAVLAELRTAHVAAYDASHAAYVAAQDAQDAANAFPHDEILEDTAAHLWAEYFRLLDVRLAAERAALDASDAATPIVLDVRGSGSGPWMSYRVRFATQDQVLAYMDAHPGRYFAEVESEPVPDACGRLVKRLYPQCEHGMSLALCMGPAHYATDEEIRQGW